MGFQSHGFATRLVWMVFMLMACSMAVVAAQELVESPAGDVKVVDGPDSSRAAVQAERALRRVQKRAAGDRTFRKLADAPLSYRDNAGDFRVAVIAPTEDQIEIRTRGDVASVSIPGKVGVRVEYRRGGTDELDERSGLHNGVATWKTNYPDVFASLSWRTGDDGAPDRLLAIVREELEREGSRLIPVHMPKWPYATASERLSQLLPPEVPPAITPKSAAPVIAPRPEGVFASPLDTVSAFRQARARKDLRASFLCLTPASQGALFREILFQTGLARVTRVAETIEQRLRIKFFDEDCQVLKNKEVEAFFTPPGAPLDRVDEAANAWLSEALRNRVGDVAGFLADCLRRFPDAPASLDLPVECEAVRIEGDKASGYAVLSVDAPRPDAVSVDAANRYLPEYVPVRFRRINGSWLIAYSFGHDDSSAR